MSRGARDQVSIRPLRTPPDKFGAWKRGILPDLVASLADTHGRLRIRIAFASGPQSDLGLPGDGHEKGRSGANPALPPQL